MARRHRLKRRELKKRFDGFVAKNDADAASEVSWTLTRDYPPMKDEVLPTLFGNRIRAFERYPNELDGADGVTLWPRLLAVVASDYSAAIGDAQAQVNCMMNLSFTALAFAVAALL